MKQKEQEICGQRSLLQLNTGRGVKGVNNQDKGSLVIIPAMTIFAYLIKTFWFLKKFSFCEEIARDFLLIFQSDKPVAIFLVKTLDQLLQSFCSKFIRKGTLSGTSTLALKIKFKQLK